MFCSKCRANIDADSGFCKNCGEKVIAPSTEGAPVIPAVPQPPRPGRGRKFWLMGVGALVVVVAVVLVLVLVVFKGGTTQQQAAGSFLQALQAKDADAVLASMDSAQAQELNTMAGDVAAQARSQVEQVAIHMGMPPEIFIQQYGKSISKTSPALQMTLKFLGMDQATLEQDIKLMSVGSGQDLVTAVYFNYQSISFDGITYAVSGSGTENSAAISGGTVTIVGLDGKSQTMDASKWLADGAIQLVKQGGSWHVDVRLDISDYLTGLNMDQLVTQWDGATGGNGKNSGQDAMNVDQASVSLIFTNLINDMNTKNVDGFISCFPPGSISDSQRQNMFNNMDWVSYSIYFLDPKPYENIVITGNSAYYDLTGDGIAFTATETHGDGASKTMTAAEFFTTSQVPFAKTGGHWYVDGSMMNTGY